MQTVTMPSYAQLALERLHAAGYEGYVVGGCVRDSLRGVPPADWDVTTSALPAETMAVFSDYPVLETGLQHGTVTVLIEHQPVEITTYRVDGCYSDGRRPDAVTFTRSLREDLARRDFTINAMANSPVGGLVDPFGGQDDLRAGLIRAVGEPDLRFGEDALRIMRALRFAAVLGFQIEAGTDISLRRSRAMLDRIARERIWAELTRLLCGQAAEAVCTAYPEVLETALGAKICANQLDRMPAVAGVRLAGMLRAYPPAKADQLLLALKCDNDTRRLCGHLLAHWEQNPPDDRPAVRRLLGTLGVETATLLIGCWRACGRPTTQAEHLLTQVLADGDCCTVAQLAIGGDALLTLGLRGRAVGDCLAALLAQVIDETLENTPQALLEAAQRTQGNGIE